jgi:hypothetical protein
VEGAGNFHDQVTDTPAPEADTLLDHTTALDTTVDVFDANPPSGQGLISRFLLLAQRAAPWLLERLEDFYSIKGEGQKAQILEQLTAVRQLVVSKVGDALVMDATFKRTAQEEDVECGLDQEDVFERVELFLAAIKAGLFSRVVGARDGTLGSVVAKRGGAGSVGSEGALSASATARASKRASTSLKWRAGASPSRRKAVRSTGKRVWTH